MSDGIIDFFGYAVPYEDLGDGRIRFQTADIPYIAPPAATPSTDSGEAR